MNIFSSTWVSSSIERGGAPTRRRNRKRAATAEYGETPEAIADDESQPSTSTKAPYRIFFSAGEPSGDMHGANLIRQLRKRHPNLQAVGFGGPRMAAAGCQLQVDLTALAVMWFLRVLLNIHKFLALGGRADRYFRHQRPDAVVLIDYPGFNWWVARRAKAHGIPVFYYAPPQIWAWASWRIGKMRRFVDHVLCSLPFEARWFSERGCRATFVGHPYFDEVRRQKLDEAFLAEHRDAERPLVTILPGSRKQEVEHNIKYFLKAARSIQAQVPKVRFAVAAFKAEHAEMVRAAAGDGDLPLSVFVGRTPELIHLAECCLAVSGSVSLELLYHAKPTAILYWISPLAYAVQKQFRRVKYITLVNLLTAADPFGKELAPYDPASPQDRAALFPEYLTYEDRSEQLARHVVGWLNDPLARQDLVEQLARLRDEVGHGGAATAAADYLLDELDRRPVPVLKPHYVPPVLPPGEPQSHHHKSAA
jgi:lipid-A-disaccharide synthase